MFSAWLTNSRIFYLPLLLCWVTTLTYSYCCPLAHTPLLGKSGLLTISWPRHRPTPSHSGALALDTPVSGALSPSDSSGPFLSLPLGLFQMLIFHLLMGGSLSITLFKIALPLCPLGPSPTPYFIFFPNTYHHLISYN